MAKSVRVLYPNLYKSKFCKLLKAQISDEHKAPAIYMKLKHESRILPKGISKKRFQEVVDGIIEQEKGHKERLTRYRILYCE